MKRFFVFASIFFVFFGVLPVFAEDIKTFEVSASVKSDRTVTLYENLIYNFTSPRHGIYRTIPVNYERNGASYHLNIRVTSVSVDERSADWKETRENGNLVLKIGDPDKTMVGEHQIHIQYQTNRALNDFPEGAELYWNVTGNGWTVPIESARFSLIAPRAPDRTQCFTGYLGSEESACAVTPNATGAYFVTTRILREGEGFTIVAGFPLGMIQPLTTGQKIGQFMQDNGWLFLPFLVFAVMFILWWKKGREPKGRGVIVAQYEEPRGLQPAVMTALMEQRVPHRAITSTILDLGRRGYLKVEFSGDDNRDIHFFKQREKDDQLVSHEEAIFEGLFEKGDRVAPKDLVGSFYRAASQAEAQIYSALRSAKLFEKNPAVVRSLWVGIAVGFFAVTIWITNSLGGVYWAAALLSAGIIAGFGWQMPRMTKEGAIVKEECEGLKLFLSVTEKARLDFSDAPERKPEEFARFLPVAVAFGVEEKWAKQFANLTIEPPSYMSGGMNAWTSLAVINAIGRMNQVSSATMFSPPRSTAGAGGSGFSGGGSGGGFGGGGGGSW